MVSALRWFYQANILLVIWTISIYVIQALRCRRQFQKAMAMKKDSRTGIKRRLKFIRQKKPGHLNKACDYKIRISIILIRPIWYCILWQPDRVLSSRINKSRGRYILNVRVLNFVADRNAQTGLYLTINIIQKTNTVQQ